MPNWPAMNTVNAYFHRLYDLLALVPAARVRYLALLLTGVWFLSLLADLVWIWVPTQSSVSAPSAHGDLDMAAVMVSRPAVTVDIPAMQSWHLFGSGQALPEAGREEKAEPDIPDDAALTTLQLELLGVLLSDVPENSYAVIQSAGQSDLYRVGDNIPVGNQVTLSKVLVNRVIINNNGRMESLLLFPENAGQQASAAVVPPQASRVIDQRSNAQLSAMASNYRSQLMSNPMSLTDVIKISIAKDGEGRILGYRIRPGRDRAQFAQFGLQTGDIVTSINGMPLDDPAKAMELYGQLREAKEASFVVLRGSEEINLIVGLNQ